MMVCSRCGQQILRVGERGQKAWGHRGERQNNSTYHVYCGVQIMKPPAETQFSKPPSRDQIAQRLAAGKAKPGQESRSSQQDIQAKVMHHVVLHSCQSTDMVEVSTSQCCLAS